MLWNLLGSSSKKNAYKNPKLLFIHFMSLKFIKTTQKSLIFWNLLGGSLIDFKSGQKGYKSSK